MNRQSVDTDKIADRYHVVARIASGGMGEVFRARDTVLGRIVAVKVLPPTLASKPGFVERFRAEAQAAASLSHPNVVQVHDWGDTGSVSYMVMEYVRGRNLREILASFGRLSPRQAAEVVIQALRALAAAHERGLVHRDVKPENILVTLDGIVKVADFGLARAAEVADMSTTGGLVGTVAYVAPEQVRGDAVDGRTDVYAMGCVLYELLTGSQPYQGDPARVLHEHLHGQVPAPSVEHPDVGDDLDRIVAKATASAPGERFTSAAQMLAALESALPALPAAPPVSELTQELTSEVSPEIQETMVPPSRRKRRVWRLLLAVLVLAGLGGLGYLFRPVKVPNVREQPAAAAKRTLNLAGLAVDFRRVPSTEPRDNVVDLSPEPGKIVRHGRTILVDVSKGPPEPSTVPMVTGMDLEQAKAAIQTAGLLLGEAKMEHLPEKAGTVVSQSLDANQKVTRGAVITLVVSSGPEYVALPDWVNRPYAEAAAALPALGLTPERADAYHPDVPEGHVIAQAPPGGAGQQIAKGSKVAFAVSRGAEPFAIGDYKGKPCATAKSELESKGVAVQVSGGACGQNAVIDQDKPAGSQVRKGTTVILYV